MLGHRHIRDSIGYVTIGLFSSALLSELSEAKKNPDGVPKESELVQTLINSLEEYKNHGSISRERYPHLMFHRHQEFETLKDVLGLPAYCSCLDDVCLKKMNKVSDIFKKIINPQTAPKERYKSIEKAIKFSFKLGKRAIYNAEFALPDNYVPLGVVDLLS